MQGTALLLLTITISITMLMNSLFYPWKKINSKPRCTLTKKVNKKRQESGCVRHGHFDLWLKHRIVLLSWHNRVQQYPPDIAPFFWRRSLPRVFHLDWQDWLLTVFCINGPLWEVLLAAIMTVRTSLQLFHLPWHWVDKQWVQRWIKCLHQATLRISEKRKKAI